MKKLYRDRWDKKIAGVCGGLGQFLRTDPTVIRLLLVFICIVTALLPFILIYIVAWMLIPLGSSTYIHYDCRRLYRSVKDRKIAGICGGIAETLKIDSILVRLVVTVILILTGFFPIIITYIIGIVIIRENPKDRIS